MYFLKARSEQIETVRFKHRYYLIHDTYFARIYECLKATAFEQYLNVGFGDLLPASVSDDYLSDRCSLLEKIKLDAAEAPTRREILLQYFEISQPSSAYRGGRG